jgi:hypothetical protein
MGTLNLRSYSCLNTGAKYQSIDHLRHYYYRSWQLQIEMIQYPQYTSTVLISARLIPLATRMMDRHPCV